MKICRMNDLKIIIFSLLGIIFLLSSAIYLTYDTQPAFAQQEISVDNSLKAGDKIREGSNFIETLLPDRQVQWESKPPQVFDGTNWKNYVYSNNPTYIRYESMGIAIDFFKDTCSFKAYDGGLIGSRSPEIESFRATLRTNDIELINPVCTVSPVSTNGTAITFDTIISDGITKLKTLYQIDYLHGLEITYEPENLETKNKQKRKTKSSEICNCSYCGKRIH